MSCLKIIATLLAAVSGLLSALYWLKSSRVSILRLSDTIPGVVESGEPLQAQAEWIVAGIQANADASRLNKIASLWSAAAVLPGTATNLLP